LSSFLNKYFPGAFATPLAGPVFSLLCITVTIGKVNLVPLAPQNTCPSVSLAIFPLAAIVVFPFLFRRHEQFLQYQQQMKNLRENLFWKVRILFKRRIFNTLIKG
jgi:hypothetical protein